MQTAVGARSLCAEIGTRRVDVIDFSCNERREMDYWGKATGKKMWMGRGGGFGESGQ